MGMASKATGIAMSRLTGAIQVFCYFFAAVAFQHFIGIGVRVAVEPGSRFILKNRFAG
jgi:hypothetical protein